MEPRDRPHRATTSSSGASELFICFTSRPSSTSTSASAATTMRVPSAKSLMSPARTAAPSLSSSLSRRLRSSGSVKAGEQSPMFPAAVAAAAARKKGCSFEAAEPSSPKVTCIGQVRVKSKKKKNKCKTTQGAAMARSRSQRRSGGEASFRRAGHGVGEGERECRPWGFCEALRSFGSEINCFVPCRGGRSSFCSSSRGGFGEEEEKRRKGSSCGGAVFGWMMAVQESEEGKGGEVVGLVVQENGGREVSLVVEKVEEENEKEVVEVEVEVEESRGSVCVPPKNALLLMRCRSDPVRMAALATRFWGSPAAAKVGAEEEEEEQQQQQKQQEQQQEEVAAVHVETVVEEEEEEPQQEQEKEEGEGEEKVEVETAIVEKEKNTEEKEEEGEEKEEAKCEVLEENGEEEKCKDESFTKSVDLAPLKEEKKRRSKGKEREIRRSRSNKEKERKRNSFSNDKEARRHSFSTERDVRRPSFSSSTMDTERRHSWSFSKKKSKEEEKDEIPNKAMDSEKGCSKVEAGEKKRELPDCLLLMMYEPKLSMEVSKETWVCSTDFLQWRPKEVVPAAAAAAAAAAVEEQTPDPAPPLSEEVEKKLVAAAEPAQVVAAAAAQVAAAAAQVAAYEPFVLTRCKSEPMRSSARLAPDACFWKSRHQPIGAAGIGF